MAANQWFDARKKHPWPVAIAKLHKSDPKTVTLALVEADVSSVNPLVPKPIPFGGYLYLLIKCDILNPPPAYLGNHVKRYQFAHGAVKGYYCAYPSPYSWRHRQTYIICFPYIVFSIDNGGKPVTEWPSDKELSERFTRLDYDPYE